MFESHAVKGNLGYINRTGPQLHASVKKSTKQNNITGGTIRELRLAQRPRVSQQDLAGRMAARGVVIDRSALARVESGERFVSDYEILAIAHALKVPVERLFLGRR